MRQQTKRSGIIIGLVALGVLAGVAMMAIPAQAVSGPGPYYAVPAWDRKMGAGRFLILTNWNSEAVLDKETGLVWERAPGIVNTWAAARLQCAARTTGARKGWRLPSIHELASLVDPSVPFPGPTLQPGHPFLSVQSSAYWSATTLADIPTAAWRVEFSFGNMTASGKTGNDLAWCVRGGMNADAY